MQLLKNCKFLLLIAALCAFSACSVGKNSSEADFLSFVENSPDCFCNSLAWESVCDGIDYSFYKNAEVPVRLHILKISLSERNLDLFAYPENNCTVLKGVSTKKIAKSKDAVVAFNTTPFSCGLSNSLFERIFSKRRRLVGIHSILENIIADPVKSYDALLFYRDKDGYFAEIANQGDSACIQADFAFGGFWQILCSGKKIPFAEYYDARTACGISKDKRTLFVLVAEKSFSSRGLSYNECAGLFLLLGAVNAIELDGGSSSSLFVDGQIKKYVSTPVNVAAVVGFRVNKTD